MTPPPDALVCEPRRRNKRKWKKLVLDANDECRCRDGCTHVLKDEPPAGPTAAGGESNRKDEPLASPTAARGDSNRTRRGPDTANVVICDNWLVDPKPHKAWSTRWTGSSEFETTDGTWKSVRHNVPRRSLMTPIGVASLTLPAGIGWTGRRQTHMCPVGPEKTAAVGA